MTKMKFYMLLIATLVITAMQSCKKYNIADTYQPTPATTVRKTGAEILTEKPWRLLSYGFDSNKNGLVDAGEESIKDCEKDNSYTFNKDGSGVVTENAMICDGNNATNQFAWTLTDNDSVLDFYYGKAYVLNLTADKLMITNSTTDEIKLLLVYGR